MKAFTSQDDNTFVTAIKNSFFSNELYQKNKN